MIGPSDKKSKNLLMIDILRSIAIAAISVTVGAIVRLVLLNALETRIVWVTFYPAVMIASLLGGLYTGILAALFSCLIAVYGWPAFVGSPFVKDYGDWLGVAVFFLNCCMISGVSEAMRRARRSADDARKQAETAREQAEAANRAKSIFLANMSHELRTPLNAILGFSSLMRHEFGLSEEQRKTLDIINRSGDHLLKLINDVLDIAKVEAGRISVENAPVDLVEMVRDVTDMLRDRADKKGLKLLVDQSTEFPRFVQTDGAKLRQVLINLVGNAIKYTVTGCVTLRLRSQSLDASEGMLLDITVIDTGVGISSEDQEEIFEPFVQAAKSSTEQGTGLGLAITRQYVKLMGGSLSLESTLGEGSKFRIELPVANVEKSNAEMVSAKQRQIVSLALGQREFRVLIVEDQVENWLLLQKLLQTVGFNVKVAQNGAEGIAVYQEWKPDFIWMDCRMPVMDGIEASKRIRAMDGGDRVKIVALTASVFKDEREKIMQAGMDDFMQKPFQIQEIYQVMEKHLGVEFVYDDGGPQRTDYESGKMMDKEALANLPQNVGEELMNALVHLDMKAVGDVVNKIADLNPALARQLFEYTDRYQYTAIKQALKDSRKE